MFGKEKGTRVRMSQHKKNVVITVKPTNIRKKNVGFFTLSWSQEIRKQPREEWQEGYLDYVAHRRAYRNKATWCYASHHDEINRCWRSLQPRRVVSFDYSGQTKSCVGHFDPGSQKNLILEVLVRKMGLQITSHPKPYPLGLIQKDIAMHITKQCTFKFAKSY